jgi:AmmeMemoRadiSam system protein B/AmmeMemoRadiSam system protein A
MKGDCNNNKNRKAVVAGRFYKKNTTDLKAEIAELLSETAISETNKCKPQAIIVPHAGYMFSGKVAGSAYQLIPPNTTYKRIFVLASSHQYHFDGAAVYTWGNYETPLGEVLVDKSTGRDLLNTSSVFQEKPEAHTEEHSLEVQLPFLQYLFGNEIQLVPLILGTNTPETCKKIAEHLQSYFTSENLFIISSDFSHYPSHADAVTVDKHTANAICSNNPEHFLGVLKEYKSLPIDNLATSLCGWTSVLTLLYLSENGKYTYKKIAYQNSGDAPLYGDKKRVVGYWAISVCAEEKQWEITKEEKHALVETARNAILYFLKNGQRKKFMPSQSKGIMQQKTGAFVSVYINGELRGCIGGFAGEKTLNQLVQEMAVASVTDSRFNAITFEETPMMKLEISILSPLKRIKSADEIELGKHGIYIKSNYNTGTFLPQVADKTGWKVEEFLGHCARDKAQIGWEGWKTAELYTYEAIVIKE